MKRKSRKSSRENIINVTPPPQQQPVQDSPRRSMLRQISEDWAASGQRLPHRDQASGLVTAYRSAHAAVVEAKKKLDALQQAESVTVLALAKAYGARPLRIDDVVHEFAARKGTVFFRRRQVDAVDVP